jgi:hypothetical protein
MVRGILALLMACLAGPLEAQAQRQMTVQQLTSFIRSSLQMRNDDRQVADFIRKIRLTHKLDVRTVEELQGLGAGPRTLAALRELSAATAKLPEPPPSEPPTAIAVIPPPDSAEQKRMLAEITRKALDYNRGLPNFICTQVTRRHADPTGREDWRLLDTIQERLSYFDHKEDYKVVLYNNQAVTGVEHNRLGGATSSGEFGTMLAEIFSPETHTEFEWERWATLRGRRMHVFAFRVLQQHSKYSILHVDSGRRVIAGYHGLIYADRDTQQVMRIKLDADGIPSDFPIQRVGLDLNYDFTEIGGQMHVLPLKADLRSSQGRYQVWNEVEFHLYRMFGADTSITFEPVGAIPEERIQEQPPEASPAKPGPPRDQK